jgi:UDP-N-acetyl-D-glucosamine dehydrogenase
MSSSKDRARAADEKEQADCLLILTHHSSLPVRLIAEHSAFVYNTRNVMTELRPDAKLVTLGNGVRTAT